MDMFYVKLDMKSSCKINWNLLGWKEEDTLRGSIMVGFKVKYYWYQIGSGDFLFSFFSTVAYNLENQKWGSKFPAIMNELYQGELSSTHIPVAINELEQIKQGLAKLL